MIERISNFNLRLKMADIDFLIKYDGDSNETILCRYVGKEKIVKIPEGISTIRKFAFASDFELNETIEEIILSSTVLKIEEEAFAYCKNLKVIVFNDEVEDVDFSCLKGCDSIEEITIPPRIESIIAFDRPANLKTIHVNDNIKHISEGAFDIYREDTDDFERHTSKILLSNPVYKIIDGFMVNTKFMTTLYRTDKSEKKVRVPDGIKVIGTNTFEEMTFGLYDDDLRTAVKVEEITLPESVKQINYNAFNSCDNLQVVKYKGKSADLNMDENAFWDCRHFLILENPIECSDIKMTAKQKRITHLMLERFRVIHRKIKSGSYPNTEELRQVCCDELGLGNKLGIATISRDLEYLRNSMEAPIIYNHLMNGYVYSEPFELKF